MYKPVQYIKSKQLRDLIHKSELDINILINVFDTKIIVLPYISLLSASNSKPQQELDGVLKAFAKKHKTVYYCTVSCVNKNDGWFNCFFCGPLDNIKQVIHRTIKYKALL